MVPRKGSHHTHTHSSTTMKGKALWCMAVRWSWWNVVAAVVLVSTCCWNEQQNGALAQRNLDLRRSSDRQLRSELLQRAIPKSKYDALRDSPFPNNNEETTGRLLENGDDYFVGEDYMYSLSGYSLKYATCQPLQQFSDSAAKAGEYSPMITDDVVILRLCPSKTCSEYIQYGCHYNFAEYVIGMKDFIRIMLRYTTDRREKMCDYCDKCGYNSGGRFLEEGNNNNNQNQDKGENNNNNNGENKDQNNNDNKNENNNNDNKNEGNNDNKDENNNKDENQNKDENENKEENKDENENKEDNGGDQQEGEEGGGDAAEADSSSSSENYSNDPCDYVNKYCSNYNKDCGDDNDDKYIDYLDYMNYLNCAKVDDKNNNRYYVRPRCDASQGTIKMAVYRDPYCSMYAGNDVSMKSIGLGFRDGIFEDFYDSRCISCAETSNPPDFGADENLCNRMHHDSAKCTSNLAYQVFDDHVDDTTECSFIESVRFGTYDSSGQFSTDSLSKVKQTVTKGQLIALGVSVVVCVVLAIYACYLHHAMTNLLIYSLSHSHLLPPSRHRSRQSRGRPRQRDYEDDWDQMAGKIPALS